MTISTLESGLSASWERRLFALAHEPLQQDDPHVSVHADAETLERAYDHCVAVTQVHSKTFYTSSALLPSAKRRAVRALYAFCRVSDDLVDKAQGDPVIELEAWRERALSAHAGKPSVATDDCPAEYGSRSARRLTSHAHAEGSQKPCREAGQSLVALAWADTMARFRIPVRYAHQLIDGVARDVHTTRYVTFGELSEYAYGVASTVGLMSMHITGFAGPEAIPYAVKLGVALQLTNILRDVGEDWETGRLYLPQDELAAFGLSEADVAAGRVDDRWRALMRFQIERNRRLYVEALPGVGMLHADGRFAIAAAAELYRGILEDIEAHDYDVFGRRAHVTRWGKLRRLPGIWWRARRGYGNRRNGQ